MQIINVVYISTVFSPPLVRVATYTHTVQQTVVGWVAACQGNFFNKIDFHTSCLEFVPVFL